NMTNGVGDLAESTLRVRGPDATVQINGDLRMAIDGFGDPALGTATLHAVITGSSHSTIVVGESAMIENGNLVVEFDGYTPRGGETYDILAASQIEGGNFSEVTLPDLPDERTWDVQVTDSLVRLMISGGLLGDFDGSGALDAADIDQLTGIALAGSNDAAFDLTSDGLVNAEDRTVWISQLRNTYLGDANLDGEFNSSDFVAVFTDGKFETGQPATWGQGDWNGDGIFGTSDFVAAFSDGGFEIGPKGAVSAVPEPHGVMALPLAVLLAFGLLRRRQ
ncbi:MAG: hypothetical protein KDA87_24635, partial [Planctomycetales bacterium]|nr:hypothetical protein [Planctomycetales bacterium]